MLSQKSMFCFTTEFFFFGLGILIETTFFKPKQQNEPQFFATFRILKI